MGFEPTTSSLGSWHSTTELRPQRQSFKDERLSWLDLSIRRPRAGPDRTRVGECNVLASLRTRGGPRDSLLAEVPPVHRARRRQRDVRFADVALVLRARRVAGEQFGVPVSGWRTVHGRGGAGARRRRSGVLAERSRMGVIWPPPPCGSGPPGRSVDRPLSDPAGPTDIDPRDRATVANSSRVQAGGEIACRKRPARRARTSATPVGGGDASTLTAAAGDPSTRPAFIASAGGRATSRVAASSAGMGACGTTLGCSRSVVIRVEWIDRSTHCFGGPR